MTVFLVALGILLWFLLSVGVAVYGLERLSFQGPDQKAIAAIVLALLLLAGLLSVLVQLPAPTSECQCTSRLLYPGSSPNEWT